MVVAMKRQRLQKKVCNKNKNSNLKITEIVQKQVNLKIKQTIQNNETDVDSLIEFLKDNKLILKSQERFRSERHNVFIQKLTKLH